MWDVETVGQALLQNTFFAGLQPFWERLSRLVSLELARGVNQLLRG